MYDYARIPTKTCIVTLRLYPKESKKGVLLIGQVNTAALILELALVSLHKTIMFCLVASSSRGLD